MWVRADVLAWGVPTLPHACLVRVQLVACFDVCLAQLRNCSSLKACVKLLRSR
jgi:hypothetical protein